LSPKVTENYKNNKIQAILEAAKRVFIRKGFFETTMQDIVNECNISRGGLYRYFSSTEEIFKELLESDVNEDENAFNSFMQMDKDAYEILKAFIEGQCENILNIKDTLIPAAYEYFIRNIRDGEVSEFLAKRHHAALMSLVRVIEYGIGRGQIPKEVDAKGICNCILAFIEGLIITAVATVVEEDVLRQQIESFNTMLGMYLKLSKMC
jgi:AcrR family transcriptional regulator